MAPSFSTTSCGKLMHVFSTDIGLLFFFLDHSPSTVINRRIIQSNKIISLDLKGGYGVQGGVVGNAGGTIILKLHQSAARLLCACCYATSNRCVAASGCISRACVRAYSWVKINYVWV